jgi:hypothetical protein
MYQRTCLECAAKVLAHRTAVERVNSINREIFDDAAQGGKRYERLLIDLAVAHEQCGHTREDILDHFASHSAVTK